MELMYITRETAPAMYRDGLGSKCFGSHLSGEMKKKTARKARPIPAFINQDAAISLNREHLELDFYRAPTVY